MQIRSHKKQLIKLALNNFVKSGLQSASLKANTSVAKPTDIFISITNRCNLNCKQCDVHLLGSVKKELSTDKWKEVLRQLRDWLGVCIIRWSGGEPFLRKDMFELLEYSSDLGILNGVITNGQLIDREMALRIVDTGVFNISLSIDGMQKGHDFVRGDGTFEKIAATAGFLNQARVSQNSDMKILVKVTIMQINLDEIMDLIEWADREGLDGVSVCPLLENLATENPDPSWFEKSPLWVKDLEKLDTVIDQLLEGTRLGGSLINPKVYIEAMRGYFHDPTASKALDFKCHVGNNHFRIDPNGDVYMCPFFAPVGNLVESTPEQIWVSKEAQNSRKRIANCRRNCLGACQHKRTLFESFALFLKLFK